MDSSENSKLLTPYYKCNTFYKEKQSPGFLSLEALDLQCQKSLFDRINDEDLQERRQSLSNISKATAIAPFLEKASSDTLFGTSRRGIQNPTWTRTIASIYNKYDQAHVATRQEGAKKTTFLLQRKISTELKVKQLERVLHPSEKKTTADKQLKALPIFPNNVQKHVTELKIHLKSIEANLQAADREEKDALKDHEATKSQQLNVVHLLEVATEDLLQAPDPIGDSPRKTPGSVPKIVISRMDSIAPTAETANGRSRTTGTKAPPPSTGPTKENARQTEGPSSFKVHGRGSRLKSLSNAMELRGWNFRSPKRSRKQKNGDGPVDDDRYRKSKTTNTHQQETNQVSKTPAATPRNVTTAIYGSKLRKLENCSAASGGSSSDEEVQKELQTEISQRALNEILAFEKLIADHMALCKNYDFPYIDD